MVVCRYPIATRHIPCFSRFSGPQQPHICPTISGQVLHTCIGIVALTTMMKTKTIDWFRRPRDQEFWSEPSPRNVLDLASA